MGLLDDFMNNSGIKAEEPKEVKEVKAEVKEVKTEAKPKAKKKKAKTKAEKTEPKGTGASMTVKTETKAMAKPDEITGDMLTAIYNQTTEVPGIGLEEINQILNWVNIKYLKIESEDANNIGKVVYGSADNKQVLDEAVMPLFYHVHRQLTPGGNDFKKILCMSADCKTGYERQKCVSCPNKAECKTITSLYVMGESETIYCLSFRQGYGTENLSKIYGFGKQWLKLGSIQKKHKDFKSFYIFDAEAIPGPAINEAVVEYAMGEVAKKINSHMKEVMSTWE